MYSPGLINPTPFFGRFDIVVVFITIEETRGLTI